MSDLNLSVHAFLTNLPTMTKRYLCFLFFAAIIPTALQAQAQPQDESASASAQANNPLANMTALNFQNYYMPVISGASSQSYMNTTWIRFAKPFASGKFLLRASVPLSTLAKRIERHQCLCFLRVGLEAHRHGRHRAHGDHAHGK